LKDKPYEGKGWTVEQEYYRGILPLPISAKVFSDNFNWQAKILYSK
jgi:hypothetical protein